jgi:Ca-activated chloride channel family protein
VNHFFHYIDRAVVTDLSVDWGAMGASEVFPKQMPDLFASHPVILHGRYRGKLEAPVISGKAGERKLKIPVVMRPAASSGDPRHVFGALWARSKIGDLEQDLAEGGAEARREITRLGIDHHLVTPFTSFVAVDRSRRVAAGTLATIEQPVEEPEGVDVEMAGGQRGEGTISPNGASIANAPPEPASMGASESRELHACGCRLPDAPARGRSLRRWARAGRDGGGGVAISRPTGWCDWLPACDAPCSRFRSRSR